MAPQPYISRPEAESFLAALGDAIEAPQENPVVFHVHGLGGVGKSTLTRKVRETFGQCRVAAVSFGLTESIEAPIRLMAELYRQLVAEDSWGHDPFWTKHEEYFSTLHRLETEAASGRGVATPEQVGWVKDLVRAGVDVGSELFLSEAAKKSVKTVADRGMDAAVAGLSLKDSLQQHLQQHRATRRNAALQTLMLEPLLPLTQAFAAGLAERSRQQPMLLVLDTYEKVPAAVDTWLWRTLLGNTPLSQQRVRLVVAGRHNIRRGEGWRKLNQDRQTIYDIGFNRFDPARTQDYLEKAGISEPETVETIYQATKGLPYYLNWIREETGKGLVVQKTHACLTLRI